MKPGFDLVNGIVVEEHVLQGGKVFVSQNFLQVVAAVLLEVSEKEGLLEI